MGNSNFTFFIGMFKMMMTSGFFHLISSIIFDFFDNLSTIHNGLFVLYLLNYNKTNLP
ncbi:hypothetical protein CWATWH0402_919 [Crocosphaera watsonii WH 0402]|uniref:Uncharacterized protein n=1 Tax=Crocosphaera watsonii WH 0402 TaxID=1284629 RepID=T2JKA6_CROWT|nr:hypothetical protein CWATWH0402_919 [Crocosphaera watsonii WH 0402]